MTDKGITGITTGVGPVDTSSGSSFMSGIYKGTAGIGQFRATITLIIVIVLGVIMLLYGTYMIYSNDDSDYLSITGSVMKTECMEQKYQNSKGVQNTTYKCQLVVGYEVDGKKYSKPMFVKSSENYMQGEPIDLWIKKDDFTNVKQAGWRSNWIGSGLSLCSIVMIGAAYLQYYLTYRYEVYAAAQGVGTVFSLIR